MDCEYLQSKNACGDYEYLEPVFRTCESCDLLCNPKRGTASECHCHCERYLQLTNQFTSSSSESDANISPTTAVKAFNLSHVLVAALPVIIVLLLILIGIFVHLKTRKTTRGRWSSARRTTIVEPQQDFLLTRCETLENPLQCRPDIINCRLDQITEQTDHVDHTNDHSIDVPGACSSDSTHQYALIREHYQQAGHMNTIRLVMQDEPVTPYTSDVGVSVPYTSDVGVSVPYTSDVGLSVPYSFLPPGDNSDDNVQTVRSSESELLSLQSDEPEPQKYSTKQVSAPPAEGQFLSSGSTDASEFSELDLISDGDTREEAESGFQGGDSSSPTAFNQHYDDDDDDDDTLIMS